MDDKFIGICPQCGAIWNSSVTKCEYCDIILTKTTMPVEQYKNLNHKEAIEWERNAIAEYAPNRSKVAIEHRQAIIKANAQKEREQMASYIPKCPTCGCPKIRRLEPHENSFHLANKTGNAHLACKTFICLNCGYAW